jgi:parallel beta-helix repeat protein
MTAPSSGLNFYMYQPDYWKIEGFSMSSSQSYANVLLYEAGDNIIANNHMSHSAYSNVQIYGDAINCNSVKILNNNITNSSTNGNAIDVEGNADSTLVQGDTISMTNTNSQDALIFYDYETSGHNGYIYYPAHNTITQNVISAYSNGVSLYGNDYPISTFTISNNNINILSTTISESGPIWLGGVGSSSVDVTYIYDNRLTGGYAGIYFYQSADYLNIYNNYISNNNYGVYVAYSSNDINSLYFNSFYNSLSNLYFVSGSNAYWNVKNNILYTTATTINGLIIPMI